MSNMKRSMRRVFWLLALCFFLLLGYLGKLVFVDREEISGNSYNSRLRYVDETIKRGDILDREGEVIATSTRQEDGIYKREYPRGRMAAHITGYSSVGKTGVEAAENFELMKLHNELFQRVSSVVRKTELQGNSVALTMDMDIQTTAGNLLGSAKGAIVVMEPSTGRILALQAYPDFDPNTVEAQWDTLKEDADSPLVNRATQGLYPPGSTFKTVTALAGMEYLSDWQSFQVECTGERVFQDKVIHCYNNKVHGMVVRLPTHATAILRHWRMKSERASWRRPCGRSAWMQTAALNWKQAETAFIWRRVLRKANWWKRQSGRAERELRPCIWQCLPLRLRMTG